MRAYLTDVDAGVEIKYTSGEESILEMEIWTATLSMNKVGTVNFE